MTHPAHDFSASHHIARPAAVPLDMAAVIRSALAEGRAVLAFQPVVPCLRPDRPIFYEALLRVRDADNRLIPARNFAVALQEPALAIEVDRACTAMVFDALARKPHLRVSLNLSVHALADPGVGERLAAGFAGDETAGERLIVELDASAARKRPGALATLAETLARNGAALGADEFGTGIVEAEFDAGPYDLIKIAGRFVQGLAEDEMQRRTVAALLDAAQRRNLLTVAQHVESEEDAQALRDLGVPCMQGFYVGLPVPLVVARMAKLEDG